MLREQVALESTADNSPTQVQTFRRWPARTPCGLRRERRAQGHPETRDTRNKLTYEVTRKNHHKTEANCRVRAEAGKRAIRGFDGCRVSNDRLARGATSSSSSGVAVSVSESTWSWSTMPPFKEENVAPVMKGSINDTGEEPLCPCRRVRQNCPCPRLLLQQKKS